MTETPRPRLRVPAAWIGATALFVAALLAPSAAPAFPSAFGRNKVQFDSFEWRVLETEHLQIHFYPEEEALARRAAEIGEEACVRLSRELGHTLTKKIPVLLYDSPSAFRQTNVTSDLVDEGTGGFTEIFRTRVVVPYSGSEPEFRHVVRHELVHAFLFDFLYGGGLRSYFVLQSAFYIPLWFAEGMAEWYSRSWDAEGEMMLRDAAISGELPPFDRIYGGYFVYKAGFSAIAYLEARYGPGVVPRLMRRLAETRDLREAILEVTGATEQAIGEDWLLDVRKATWPQVANLDRPDRFGKVVAKRETSGGFLNGNPVLAPSGKRVVFLSDRSGTPDLYALDLETPDVRPSVLARGAREALFESLHPLRSAAGWSADESMIVIAARNGARDALYILDATDGHVVRVMTPELDALERPDWSRADARFAFTGMRGGQVDLYILEADGDAMTALTNDLFVERGARWSPDGRQLAYSSDAGDGATLDVFVMDVESRETRLLAGGPGDQRDPAWRGSGNEIVYVSDEFGTRDLMTVGVSEGAVPRRISALIGGADSPSAAWDSNRLAFAAYDHGGWDLVLVENADTLSTKELPPVAVGANPWDGRVLRAPRADSTSTDSTLTPVAAVLADTSSAAPFPPVVRSYRSRYRAEWVTGAFAYGALGATGGLHASIVDVLGDHRFDVGAQLGRRLEDADGYMRASLLGGRLDWEATLFHVKDFLYDDRTSFGQPIGEEDDRTFFSERRWGVAAAAVYPFDTFRRALLEVSATRLERTVFTDESRQFGADLETRSRQTGDLVIPRVAYTTDNTLWGSTGPLQGTRSVVSLAHSIPGRGDRLVFGTALLDWRRYARWNRTYSLATRFLAASSFGEDPQQFQIGGPWTVRGHPLRAARGRNTAQASAEFRYPFIEHVRLGWPFRASFGGVRGALFTDVGTAFDDWSGFRLRAQHSGQGDLAWRDVKVGFGAGVRLRVAFLPIRVDVGWPTDFARVGGPRWHFAIGPEL